MTTAKSPRRILKMQADKMATKLKAMERGDSSIPDPMGKIAKARARGGIVFGVVMDDKVIQIELEWSKIRECSEAGISELILQRMQEIRETEQ